MTRFGTMTLAAAALLFAVACGEDDGETPKCDKLPLYGYDEIQDPANLAARKAASDSPGFCVTMASDGVGSGTGGTAGAGGGAGAGGSAGSAQDAGGD